MNIQTIGVVGAGQMGAGLPTSRRQLAQGTSSGCRSRARVSGSKSGIVKRLERREGLMTQHDADAASRIEAVGSLDAMVDADLVVEAVSENEGLKNRIFKTLDEVCPEHVILASNTSSIPITAWLRRRRADLIDSSECTL